MDSSNENMIINEDCNKKLPKTQQEIYKKWISNEENHEKYLLKQKLWYEKNKEDLKEKARVRSRIAYAKKKDVMMASQSVKV